MKPHYDIDDPGLSLTPFGRYIVRLLAVAILVALVAFAIAYHLAHAECASCYDDSQLEACCIERSLDDAGRLVLAFEVCNVGTGDMTGPTSYDEYNGTVLIGTGAIPALSHASCTVVHFAAGQDYRGVFRAVVWQRPGYPGAPSVEVGECTHTGYPFDPAEMYFRAYVPGVRS